MGELFQLFWSAAFLASAVRLAIPVLLAGVGEAVSERAGGLNIGLEGMMLAGAFGAVVGADVSGSPWIGLLVGALAAMLMALPHGLVAINLGADQIVSGVALNLGALGLTTYLSRQIWGVAETRPTVPHFTPIHVPGLSDLPAVGKALFGQSPLAYLAVALAAVFAFLLWRTRWGLRWRAAGQDPEALDSIGVSVNRVRWGALMVAGGLAGLAGSVISLGQLFTFVENMTGGRGFIALALVIVARWSPLWAVAAALLFGAADAIALRVQALGITVIPYQLSLMLPYVLTLVVYALAAGSGRAPRALGRPFVKS